MNRVIKFRGHTGTEWVYGFLWGSIDPTKEDTTFRAWFIYTGVSIEEGHKVDPESVGQFTGLLDKNGKEIYEGDRLKDSSGYIWVVYWYEDHACFGCYDESLPHIKHEIIDNLNFKVIGNVFENHELIK